MQADQPTTITWAAPTAHELGDLLAIAARRAHTGDQYSDGCRTAAHWANSSDATAAAAQDRVITALNTRTPNGDGIADTLMWLLGDARPPLELPRRNPDGTLVDAEQILEELRAAAPLPWIAEQRHAAQDKARQTAARYAALAEP